MSVGAIRMASGLRAITASSTGTCSDRVEVRSALEDQFDAKRVGSGLRALAHGDVEGIGGQAGDQRDGVFLVLRMAGHGCQTDAGCHGEQPRISELNDAS